MTQGDRHDLAVFIDFENIALGLRGRADATFDVQKVLQRLLEIGNVLVKRAYADWSRFGYYTKPFHEAAIELIEIPRRGDSGKNSADIRLCVDAMDLCYAKSHVDTFVIVSGDSDFSPLVSKLRENGKRVIGLGLRGSTSNLLVSNCDEFIYYESLDRHAAVPRSAPTQSGPDKDALRKLVAQTVAALLREGREPMQASLVKDTLKRKQPSFSETEYGFRSFTEVLEDAQEHGLIVMNKDARSGTYLVGLPKPEGAAAPASEVAAPASETPAAAPVSAPAAAPSAPSAPRPQGRDGRHRRDGRRWEPRRAAAPAVPMSAPAAPTPESAAPSPTPTASPAPAPIEAPASVSVETSAPPPITAPVAPPSAPPAPAPAPKTPARPAPAKAAPRAAAAQRGRARAKPRAEARPPARSEPRVPPPPATRPRRRVPPKV